ncbi:MAG: hypothetical protein B7X57_11205, partial [Erythrobacter sp. 34-65-8]
AELNTALRRLAQDPRNVDALLDAGGASLKVNDVDAAIGFFGRAEELSPSNPRVKIGLAAAYTRKQRPIEALKLFDEAEAAGASTAELASDRGLAYDLVGDNVSAQRQYEIALARGDDAEARRRLALSHAIAGDRARFEQVLAPLIAQADSASYRARAFGMAILGEEAEAVAIAEAVMPRNLSARMTPYLRYMPRLTDAQQAAAVNLGVFPRAAQIGRDGPQVAAYTPRQTTPGADARLAPQGEPLGPRPRNTNSRRGAEQGRNANARTLAGASDKAAELAPALTDAGATAVQPAPVPVAQAVVPRTEIVQPERSPVIQPGSEAVAEPAPTTGNMAPAALRLA